VKFFIDADLPRIESNTPVFGIGSNVFMMNIHERHFVSAVKIRLIANGGITQVHQHKVRGRQRDHAYSKGKNTNRILQFIFQQIAEGYFEGVEKHRDLTVNDEWLKVKGERLKNRAGDWEDIRNPKFDISPAKL
jgi:hypothetical protein